MPDETQIPQLPASLRAPEPVIIAGMLLWAVATVVVWLTGIGPDRALTVCLVGLGVGVLGTAVVLIQKAGVRRGSRGAQEGLDAS
ncbi:DUF2530 domain-containing protein [Gordonia sp. (in: high G+C Gram-positive bacteria)]|uniref:DUF2530 domain-containing protein n=1 Tax=Gordonia sp. (in: high G+C Gram-positive bacteria) TaxID=84139 RepID=UPI0016A8ADC9|nr:DUF2530 domain-containing protein [Gordonia sp. (in: high G+C Gram-positive bacteria)]NLG46854.1 DUF2530 domain-containing protein [Gordonia sp. (in: high G+C Gram-positive bacteria)]